MRVSPPSRGHRRFPGLPRSLREPTGHRLHATGASYVHTARTTRATSGVGGGVLGEGEA